jgi:hypothetical protein
MLASAHKCAAFISVKVAGRVKVLVVTTASMAITTSAIVLSPANTNRGKAAEAPTVQLPFKTNTWIGITKGIDPARARQFCSDGKVDLSDQRLYSPEVNVWTISRDKDSFKATFDSDQSDKIWKAVGRGTDKEFSASFDNGGIAAQLYPGRSYAEGWQIARECVGKVRMACPYIVATTELKATDEVRNAPHLQKPCKVLEDDGDIKIH